MSDVSLLLSSLVVLLTFIAFYRQWKLHKFWSSRGIKGPTPWPFIGTNIYYMFKKKVEVDQEWREKYGHVYGVFEGSEPALRVTDNDLLKFIYIKQFPSFTDRNMKQIHSGRVKSWLFWSKGEHWSNQRVLITPMFTSNRMKNMFNVMIKCAKRFTQEVDSRLKHTIKSEISDNQSINSTQENNNNNNNNSISKMEKVKDLYKVCEKTNFSKDELMAVALDVIAQTFFSLKVDTYKDKTSEFFKRAFAFARFDVPHFILWTLIPRKICRYMEWDLVTYSQYEYFDKLGQSLITKRRNNTMEKKNDMIQALLDAYVPAKEEGEQEQEKVFSELDDHDAHYNDNMKHDEMEQDHKKQKQNIKFRKFDDAEIRGQMTFFFLAGFETTSSSLSFCFYELAREQKLQQEIYEELLNLPSVSTDHDEPLDYTELMGLKKLSAFVAETLRIHAPVTENNRLVTCKGGIELPTSPPVHLPEGCIVSTPPLVIHREPSTWKDPLSFDMSRFYPENRDKLPSCAYMPFGLGPRNCAGMRFALLNIKTLLANTLLKYKVLAHDEEKMKTYPPEYNQHAFFLQLTDTNFRLMPREPQEILTTV